MSAPYERRRGDAQRAFTASASPPAAPVRTLEATNIARREGFTADAPAQPARARGFEYAEGVTPPAAPPAESTREQNTPVQATPSAPAAGPAVEAGRGPNGQRTLDATNIARREGFSETVPNVPAASGFEPADPEGPGPTLRGVTIGSPSGPGGMR